jgi:hypothetical protein
MSTSLLKQVFTTPDGKNFDTKAEAMAYLRRPQIEAAMQQIEGVKQDLATWLVENQEQVEMAFETGTIRRVSKTEAKKLKETLAHIAEVLKDDKKAAFVIEHAGAIQDSFRWPSVKRMDEQEKATAARNSLVAASQGNEELANWIVANKDAVLEAYKAGVEKREVSPKASEALAQYRAKMAAEKAAKATAA